MAGRLRLHIGWSNSLGWYEGFCLLVAVNPAGAITGFGFASASTKDQPLAESFFALRARPDPRLQSVGLAALGPYVVDKGLEGEDNHRRWLHRYGAQLICPPKRTDRKSTRLNSSHANISYAVLCLKIKKQTAAPPPYTLHRAAPTRPVSHRPSAAPHSFRPHHLLPYRR